MTDKPVRVRFAPSPTGALHIGGVRTALYNYLWAKKHKGTFVLRIEDTDQTRYVPGAEAYIVEALEWLGLKLDEGPTQGGEYGPYRQSERKEQGLYVQFAQRLIDNGYGYYAFDTPEELEEVRASFDKEGKTFSYGAATRMQLKNSLTLSAAEQKTYLESGDYVVRIKLPANEEVHMTDLIRGHVTYNTKDMDDKVMLKGDGMPTYHLANIVDDYHMKTSHVIRGEEWLPSLPLHVLLYKYLGWADAMPQFAHLPLILRPEGNGKLSKRDGAKFGIPVFPLDFVNEANPDEPIKGFREWGFEPAAVLNFLALLGWHPESDQEIFSLDELVDSFDLDRVSKNGARFDFNKAKWFNQQYLMRLSDQELAERLAPLAKDLGIDTNLSYLAAVAGQMKERVEFLTEFFSNGHYFFKNPNYADMSPSDAKDLEKKVLKKWDANRKALFLSLKEELMASQDFSTQALHDLVEIFMNKHELKFGDVLPVLRLALTGTLKGPGVFEMMEIIGKKYVEERLHAFFEFCDAGIIAN